MARSLKFIFFHNYFLLIVAVAIIGVSGYIAVRDMQHAAYRDKTYQVVATAVTRVSDVLAQQRQALNTFSRQAALAEVLSHGTAAERERREVEIKTSLPGAHAVHLIPNTPAATANEKDAALLVGLQRLAATGAPAISEQRDSGGHPTRYAMATAVVVDRGNPAGYLLVHYGEDSLRPILSAALPPNARLEVLQPSSRGTMMSVLAVGTSAHPEFEPVTLGIEPGDWILVYQPSEPPLALLAGNRIYALAMVVAAMLVMVIVLIRLYRRTTRSVRHDILSLIRMFQDLRESSVRVSYPMALKEFSEIFEYLRDRGQKLVQEKEKLKDMGLMDHLSQLGNRRHFESRLKELFDASKANGPSSVLIIDMDHFKAVNDKHGHDAGDALIVGFANALRKVVRQTDVLCRLGGDEFCIIYTYAPLKKAAELAERLRRQLPREVPLTKGVIHQLRWTGGLSAMSDKDAKPDDVLWRADQALLRAKEAGRNNTKIYDPSTGAPVKKQIMAS